MVDDHVTESDDTIKFDSNDMFINQQQVVELLHRLSDKFDESIKTIEEKALELFRFSGLLVTAIFGTIIAMDGIDVNITGLSAATVIFTYLVHFFMFLSTIRTVEYGYVLGTDEPMDYDKITDKYVRLPQSAFYSQIISDYVGITVDGKYYPSIIDAFERINISKSNAYRMTLKSSLPFLMAGILFIPVVYFSSEWFLLVQVLTSVTMYLVINLNPFSETWKLLKEFRKNKNLISRAH